MLIIIHFHEPVGARIATTAVEIESELRKLILVGGLPADEIVCASASSSWTTLRSVAPAQRRQRGQILGWRTRWDDVAYDRESKFLFPNG